MFPNYFIREASPQPKYDFCSEMLPDISKHQFGNIILKRKCTLSKYKNRDITITEVYMWRGSYEISAEMVT